jgi:two-component system, chemotaxis family, protein-glutamate methylesterase/glutaminase
VTGRFKALVIDDSAFARKVVREILEESGKFHVVGIARDGLEALEAIAELAPDVITLDLMMPELDGIGVLEALGDRGPPAVVVSISGSDTQLGASALLKGAVDIVEKPSALAIDRLYEMGDELVAKVFAAATARRPVRTEEVQAVLHATATSRFGLIAIGASTGGPRAVSTVIRALPPHLPVPVIAAIHIPDGYTQPLAERLTQESRSTVLEGRDGAPLEAGTVVLAPGGHQSSVIGSPGHLRLAVSEPPHRAAFSPSIDLLFESAARAASPILGAVLTGMGSDGTAGAKAIRAAGGAVVTESETTCVVYGMPRSVIEAGASDLSLPLEKIAEWLVHRLGS